MPQCQLCRNDRVLCNSHIVPEFLWSDLYNSKHQLMGINGEGQKGWRTLQKGIREKLFCNDCEQYFNEQFEKPFRRSWVESFPLNDPWIEGAIQWVSVEYALFKLFHLSVLYRAHVSTLPEFAAVDLGIHADTMRRMLLELDAGRSDQYPVFGYAVIHHATRRIVQCVTRAEDSKFDGRRCYGMMYGGVHWWILVTSDRSNEFQRMALQPDGQMPFIGVPWNEVGIIQDASAALRSATHD